MKQDSIKNNVVQEEKKESTRENPSKKYPVYSNESCIKMFDYLSF